MRRDWEGVGITLKHMKNNSFVVKSNGEEISMAALGFLMHIVKDAGAFRSLETRLQRLPPSQFYSRFQLYGQIVQLPQTSTNKDGFDMSEIKAIRCRAGNCFGGMKGNQTCHACDGTGSEISVQDGKGEWHYFPNTKEGDDDARAAIDVYAKLSASPATAQDKSP